MEKYTAQQRKDIAIVFTRAKKNLLSGADLIKGYPYDLMKNTFICFAITETKPYTYNDPRVRLAIDIIHTRLGHNDTVEDFLIDKKLCTLKQLNSDCGKVSEQVQDFRHRWLDELIREFSNAS